jgi:hypothetical protein
VRKKYQRKDRKSNHKFEVVQGQELMVRVPLPIAEVWAEMQAKVEELTGQAGLQILRAILENEVTHRVGPPHRPNPTAGCVRWGKQPGYVVFAGQKIPLERPRVRTREGQEVELQSYGQLQQGRKSLPLLLCRTLVLIRWFDPIAEASELPDHFRSAPLFRLFGDGRAPFFVTNSLVQD